MAGESSTPCLTVKIGGSEVYIIDITVMAIFLQRSLHKAWPHERSKHNDSSDPLQANGPGSGSAVT